LFNILTVKHISEIVHYQFLFVKEISDGNIILVNARHVKNVPGRKTDVLDCQWLHRDNLVKLASSHVQHIQKTLTQMNLQIHNVIRDITGVTGLAIIDPILSGEKDPEKLAELKDWRIKADTSTIVKSLKGDYRSEHIFTLKQSFQSYRNYQLMINECDSEIEKHIKQFESCIDLGMPKK